MTLQELMEHFFRMYERRNRIFLSSFGSRINFLNLALGDLQEAIRKEASAEHIGVALARCVSRIFCIAESFYNLPLVEVLARKYPKGRCTYCNRWPCRCQERRSDAGLALRPSAEQLQWSLGDWCTHFNSLYGLRNKSVGIENILNRLFKEVSELLSIEMMIASMTEATLDEIELEIALESADTLAWTIGVANFLGVDLEEAVLKRFVNDGCWKCHQPQCVCGYFNLRPVKWEELPL